MDRMIIAKELVKIAKTLVAGKWLAKLISPNGKEFWAAYGPMVSDRDKAMRFMNPIAAERSARHYFGRSGDAFWESERRQQNRAYKEYKGWSYEIVEE